MYDYRRASPEERVALLQRRREIGYPPHSPPRFVRKGNVFLLSAAIYNHRPLMVDPARRATLRAELFDAFPHAGHAIQAWAVLPNHYHLLIELSELQSVSRLIGQLHGRLAHTWNGEDAQRGRKVWHRFTDRAMRSKAHYYTTLNYIHFNPVKHAYVSSPYDWVDSSVHWYLEANGREWLREVWPTYPVKQYGERWDDFPNG